jgi:aryl-alcohol dehydrogenase-like predicted oxidoreductase
MNGELLELVSKKGWGRLFSLSRPAQIEENIKFIQFELTDELLAQAEAILAEISGFSPMG